MSSGTRSRKWALRLAPGAVLILGLVVAELALRLVKPGFLVPEGNPYPAGMPYFQTVRENGSTYYTPTRYFQAWGHSFKFEMPKPAGTFRIFILGDSTANGHSFGNPGAFAKWLEVMLGPVDPMTRYEIINTGQPSFPASEMLWLERQAVAAQPDLIVVYASNNEFFYRRGRPDFQRPPDWMARLRYRCYESWLFRLAAYPRDRRRRFPFALDPTVMRTHAAQVIEREIAHGDDHNIIAPVLKRFREDLAGIVKLARENGARTILCTIPVNLRDHEPSGSYFQKMLPPVQITQWQHLVDQSKDAFGQGDFAAARDALLKAAELDDSPAELNFVLGHVMLKLGDRGRAREYFETAAANDFLRDRAARDMNGIVREVAREQGAGLVDLAENFRSRARDTVPGDDLFVDAVHPTLEGQRLIAASILDVLVRQGVVPPQPNWDQLARQAADSYQSKMPDSYLFKSYHTAATLNAFLGRFRRAKLWAGTARHYGPREPDGIKLDDCLDRILLQYANEYDPDLPWGEFEFARTGPPAGKYHPGP